MWNLFSVCIYKTLYICKWVQFSFHFINKKYQTASPLTTLPLSQKWLWDGISWGSQIPNECGFSISAKIKKSPGIWNPGDGDRGFSGGGDFFVGLDILSKSHPCTIWWTRKCWLRLHNIVYLKMRLFKMRPNYMMTWIYEVSWIYKARCRFCQAFSVKSY